jgi:hypothetical protein
MSITLTGIGSFGIGIRILDDPVQTFPEPFTYTNPADIIALTNVSETANDGSAPNAYASLLSSQSPLTFAGISGTYTPTFDISASFFHSVAANTDATGETAINFTFDLEAFTIVNGAAIPDGTAEFSILLGLQPFPVSVLQNDVLGIERTDTMSMNEFTQEVLAIDTGQTTEFQLVNSLLSAVADTTIPAVAVEGSMYNAVGSSDEITKLVTEFLPAQVANALQNGYIAQVYVCEALGLAFAFGNENGATTFDTNFGPSNPATPATPAGDAAFAAEAANAIFGAAATANTPGAILQFVSNWEAFYTAHGVPGIPNATTDQIDLAARGAAWGDAVGVVFANNLGSLPNQAITFLENAAHGTANYSASLTNQPILEPFQGQPTLIVPALPLIGVAASSDHIVM